MAEPVPDTERPERVRRSFATTHWSLIRAAGAAQSPETASALEALCRIYWYPVYFHIRFRGYKPEDAQDLTQAFFAGLLEKDLFGHADPDRGRFRSFLLGSLEHFLHDAYDFRNARKRGGGYRIISWDDANAEDRLARYAADNDSPDRLFDRHWAETILERAATRLRGDYETSGRGALYEAIRSFANWEPGDDTLADTARILGISLSATKSAIYRLRRHYYSIIRDEVAQTLSDASELNDELRHLLAAVLPATSKP